MKLEETRPGVFVATMTAHELSVLVAGARMSLSLLEAEGSTDRPREALETVLANVDTAMARARDRRGAAG